mmetsp:Transcript_14851/g.29981  ORF Transcript_14851/g.29981 Transcript_14851/m.29981 type:complete len:226 (-) Transcript_14851:503-1180(-)
MLNRVASVDLLKNLVVRVLDPDLNSGTSEPTEAVQLILVDEVRPGLQRDSDNSGLRGFVSPLLFLKRQRGSLSLHSSSLSALVQRLVRNIVKNVCSIKEVPHKFFLVVPRIAGPGTPKDQNFDFVDRVSVSLEGPRPVVELGHGVPPVLVRTEHCGLCREVGARLSRLLRAVVAVLWAREGTGTGQDCDDDHTRSRPHNLFDEELLDEGISCEFACLEELLIRSD